MESTEAGRALVHGTDLAAPAVRPWIAAATDVRHLHPDDDTCGLPADVDAESVDVIVDAGPLERRLIFAVWAWPRLAVGGRLVLVAAGSARAIGITFAVALQVFRELDRIDIVPDGADVAILRKCGPKPYANWNRVEGRASWQVGDDDLVATLERLGAA